MSIALPTALFQLPSVQRFLNRLADDLANSRNLLILLPVGVDPLEVSAALRAELWRRGFTFEEVLLSGLPKDRVPVSVLSEGLGISWDPPDTPRTIQNLMAIEQLPDLILLEDFDQLPDPACKNWIVFLRQWAQTCQTMADRGSPTTALCMVMPAVAILPEIPESSVYLAVHWWWGFPSALEMHMLCRLSNEHDSWDTMARWREYMLPALVGNDVPLASYLWNDLHVPLDILLSHLRSYAEQRDWKAEALRTWGAGGMAVASNRDQRLMQLFPPIDLRTLWAHGAIGWTLEYGLEVHAAVLALLGRREELQHRLWRGQAELLLPIIDQIRLALCDHLTCTYGSDWPVRWCQPVSPEEDAAVRNSPLACQWGHLEVLLRRSASLRSEERWLPLASLSRWVRNEIAHYRPITFRDFEGVWREIDRVTESMEMSGRFGGLR